MRYLIIVALLLSFPILSSAQRGGDRFKEIEAYKVTFLTEKLDLSADEAKIFWPVYNAWQAEQQVLRRERMQKMISFRKMTEIEELSDSEVQTLILNEFNIKQRELNLDKKYYYKLKSSLPIKIVGKFYRAQEAFKKEILAKYRPQARQ
ncbi:MAG: hypothetical protein WKF66_19725 [Pedobacter sp.]